MFYGISNNFILQVLKQRNDKAKTTIIFQTFTTFQKYSLKKTKVEENKQLKNIYIIVC